MQNRRFVLAAALTAAATAVTFAAATPAAQGTNPGTSDWCRSNHYSEDRVTHSEVRDFAVPASGATLTVDASPNGGIRVEGQSRADVHVQACVSASAESIEQARALAQQVEVTATGERVAARGPQELERGQGWHVSYRLAVPTRIPMSLRSHNGGISLTDVEGEISFQTVNGGVSLTRVGGTVKGRTSNGGVMVDLDGSTWNGEGLDVETQNGGVRLAIPANYSARLDAGTVNGGLNVDFPGAVQGRVGKSVQTELGAGGPLIRVRTSNGGVNVRRK